MSTRKNKNFLLSFFKVFLSYFGDFLDFESEEKHQSKC